MTKNNGYSKNNPQVLREERNRIVAVIRQMLVPKGSDPGAEPFVFISGNPLDMTGIKLVSALAEKLDEDVVYVEFEPGQAVLRPRSISVVTARDHICYLVRGCDLWIGCDQSKGVLVPRQAIGHILCDGEELVHLPGRPSNNVAPGIARARAEIMARAIALPEEEAKRCFDPFERVAG